jgi:hypothetical protein
MAEITYERLTAIRARIDAASPGPHARTDLGDLLDAAAVLCHARAVAERERYVLRPEQSTRWCRDGCPVCADPKWYARSPGGVLRELCELLLSGQPSRYSDSTPGGGRG